jgi:protein-glutamine gamma-glutamyltransferase
MDGGNHMIRINGAIVRAESILTQYPEGSIERDMLNIFGNSSFIYEFDSIDQLDFEISLRKNVVDSSILLNDSRFGFSTFRNSKCNPDFWTRTDEGGFLIKKEVSPYAAIQDIFNNSSKYANECATAIVIVYLKAVLHKYGKELFDQMFSDIYLMNWQSLDKDLGFYILNNPMDYFPGDCRYFKNPDYNPLTPYWQGENVIDLSNGKYYGHGIGIKSADEIIASLNEQRISDSTQSAYLLDSVVLISYKYLYYRYRQYMNRAGN